MRIDELVWDEWNEEHIARRGLGPEDVEQVVFDPSSWVLRTRDAESRRYIVLGLTDAGRYLAVVLDPQGRGQAYVVTARDMTDREKRGYKSR